MNSTITIGIYSSLANNGFGNNLQPGLRLQHLPQNIEQSDQLADALTAVAVSVDLDTISMHDALRCIIPRCAPPLEHQYIDVNGKRFSLQDTERIYKAAKEVDARKQRYRKIAGENKKRS